MYVEIYNNNNNNVIIIINMKTSLRKYATKIKKRMRNTQKSLFTL